MKIDNFNIPLSRQYNFPSFFVKRQFYVTFNDVLLFNEFMTKLH